MTQPPEPYLDYSISPLIDSQFPLFYQESSPLFISFLKAYQEWTEDPTHQGATTFYSRNMLDLRDVDRTPALGEFLVFIKSKYLDRLQLTTRSDTRQLIKHAKDLYRAKGSPRALDLFFRLLYDEVIQLYYPKDDILVASDGTWVRPAYLELSLSLNNALLENKKVVGLSSGATGYVDGVTRRVIAGRLHDSAYLSAIDGNFRTGEVVTPTDGSLPVMESPTIIGSLNELTLDAAGSGAGYSVGDVVPINSNFGVLGLARVSETVTQTGLISLELEAGGYGYTTAETTLWVSDTVLNLSNVAVTNSQARSHFRTFDSVTQSWQTYGFVNSSANAFSPGDSVQTYSPAGTGTVLSVSYSNSSAGVMTLQTLSGSLNANAIYNSGNTEFANLALGGFSDETAVGWVLGTGTLTLTFESNVSLLFTQGETVVQNNPLWPTDGAVIGQGTVTSSANGFITVDSVRGVFQPGTVLGLSSGASATVGAVEIQVGIKVTNSAFISLPGNLLVGPSSRGQVTLQGSAITASFGIADTLAFTESVQVNTDWLSGWTAANLNANGWFGNSSANATTDFSSYLQYQTETVGAVSAVFTVTGGTQFDTPPMVLVEGNRTFQYQDFDFTIPFTGATQAFAPGETITQSATGARGLVESVANGVMTVGNLRFYSNQAFVATSNSTTQIVGGQSGAVANATAVYANRDVPPVGLNAEVVPVTVTANGAVSAVTVQDSGFGYVQGETVWLGTGPAPTGNSATGLVQLQTNGTRRGFYTDEGGFLSDRKKLFDGDYYQNFSYEVTSSQQLETYLSMLKDVVHVAGMKVFGKYKHSRSVGTPAVHATPAQVTVTANHPVGAGTSVGSATATATVNSDYATGTARGSGSAQASVLKVYARGSAVGAATVSGHH